MTPPSDSAPAPAPEAPPGTPPPPESTAKKRKFNPWEWAIVVVIILVLVAIAIPNFVKARTTNCKNACIANLKQIDGAIQQWALENKKQGADIVTTTDVLDYLKGSQLPQCPGAGTYATSTVSSVPTCSMRPTFPDHSL
jgi:competence protein ComGC